MRKRALFIWLLLLICTVTLTRAQAPLTLAQCSPPDAPGYKTITFDAAKDSVTPDRKYRLADRVRIVIINKNPFANDYKLTIEEREVGEPALQRFLKAFSFIGNIAPEAQPAAMGAAGDQPANAPDAAPSFDGTVDPCAAILNPLASLRARITEQDNALSVADLDAQRKLSTVLASHKAVVETIKPHLKVMAQDKIGCDILKPRAEDFLRIVQTAESSLDLKPLREQSTAIKDALAAQTARVAVYEESAESLVEGSGESQCRKVVADDLRNWRNQITVTSGNIAKIEAKVKELDTAIRALMDQTKDVEEIGSRTEAFYEVHTLRTFDVPTDVTVQLKSKKRDSEKPVDFTTAVETKLNFGGGPVFSLTAGIAFSRFEDRTYTRVQGLARTTPDSAPAPPVQAVVGLEEDSDWRTTPLILIHARFWESTAARLAIHASFGLSAKIENSDTDAEYLAGVSFSFAKNLFLTVGGYYGEFDRLAGDLYVGAPLPDDVPKPPVRPDHTWKPGLAVTYKIQ